MTGTPQSSMEIPVERSKINRERQREGRPTSQANQ